MQTRRDFIRKAALLSATGALGTVFPEAIQRALAIHPATGSTWKDAEHVVILMQENRSFDHCYGSLRGVRGFNDPRAIDLPDGKPVWLQSNSAGETFGPFRLNNKDTRATWMGSLPHSWTDQVDARNEGKMDRWLDVKRSGHEVFSKMPLTMGYYNREDLPFYYSLADSFTVCDQNFCSALTGTTPNRLYLWTGTIREKQNEDTQARVLNEDADHDTQVSWKTFPERLEENGIAWKVYQNELTIDTGLAAEQDAWLSNFGDNPLEYFTQYNVRFHPAYIRNLPRKIARLPGEIAALKETSKTTSATEREKLTKWIAGKENQLTRAIADQKQYTGSGYEKLSPEEKSIHEKAFANNNGLDPDFDQLTTLRYAAGAEKNEMQIPKGDVLARFRKDVATGSLPVVSWLVAPENLSDHPTAPWYGAAYVSEALDILTQNPEVWKKTIFILAYDENDGYFDHIPPFTAPHPDKPETGKTSGDIDARVDYVTFAQDTKWRPSDHARESPVGLGFRVPLVIASPWSRGGVVNSQVFDHTSVLQFLEKFLEVKTGKKITESNISSWRRAVCGDLTSTFSPYNGETIELPKFIKTDEFYQDIHQAKLKREPGAFTQVPKTDVIAIRKGASAKQYLTSQEKGTRTSNALPYQLYADGALSEDKKSFQIKFESSSQFFGGAAAGAPFNVYSPARYRKNSSKDFQKMQSWSYAVNAGSHVIDNWLLSNFADRNYDLSVYGPNGFFRSFKGNERDPMVTFGVLYDAPTTGTNNLTITISGKSTEPLTIKMMDRSYGAKPQSATIGANAVASLPVNLARSGGWYDFQILINGHPGFERRYAGRVENGKNGITDPAMAG